MCTDKRYIEGKIIVKPITGVRGRNNLKELVSKIPERYQVKETDWSPPVGMEVW